MKKRIKFKNTRKIKNKKKTKQNKENKKKIINYILTIKITI